MWAFAPRPVAPTASREAHAGSSGRLLKLAVVRKNWAGHRHRATRINIQSAKPTRLTPTDTILLWAPERLANFLEGVVAREANIPERTVAHQREFTTTFHTPPPSSN